jgi:2-polyprenyl-3-methyl-5-hydroxy-6-metoxy-1,4-benzoquinol methylase
MIAVDNKYSTICPICGGQALDRVYSFADFSVMRCERCDNSWRTNMYTKEIIEQMYCEEDYDQHPFFAFEKHEVEQPSGARFKNFQRALNDIDALVGTGRILDIACGSGAFLAIAQRRGWDVYGVEISAALCRVCRENTDATLYNTSFEEADLPLAAFDAVTMWDIIEHVLDPVAFIAKARSLLKPGGVLLICTPDEDSLLARTGWALYKSTGATYRYPALALHPRYHTFFFSRKSLRRLLNQHGMKVSRAYSQQAFFQHSPLASAVQKRAIAIIEKLASAFDTCYECVLIARL